MNHVPAYQRPGFRQSLTEDGEGWTLTDGEGFGCLTYQRGEETAVVPAIWYNQPPATYAQSLRWYAERSDETARYHATSGKPWSGHDADRAALDARRLRAMAILCDHSTASTAGGVDLLGMSSPGQTREELLAAMEKAEALARS